MKNSTVKSVNPFKNFHSHISGPEDGGVVLHGLLHVEPELGGRGGAVGEAELVEVGHGELAGVGRELADLLAGLVLLGDGLGAGAAEDDQVEQGVDAQAVGAVHGGAGGLAGGVQSGNDGVLAVLVGDDLMKGKKKTILKNISSSSSNGL